MAAVWTKKRKFSFEDEEFSKNGDNLEKRNYFRGTARLNARGKRELRKERTERALEKQEVKKESVKPRGEELKPEGRKYTLSIAVPGSILNNIQTKELKYYVVGEIARTAVIFNVDEIVVFDDMGVTRKDETEKDDNWGKNGRACLLMGRILQFLECPQYLRRTLFPVHEDLQLTGLLNPLDSVHHLRENDYCQYREGVVSKIRPTNGIGSLVNVGFTKEVYVDKHLKANVRVTVKLEKNYNPGAKKIRGTAVAPHVPRTKGGLYWGYNVRLAHSLGSVLSECPFRRGYDVKIGTSESGTSVDEFTLPKFRHLLVIFGSLRGLEASLEADTTIDTTEPSLFFDHYLNVCPNQGSRVIRTEEAIVISLAMLRSQIAGWCCPLVTFDGNIMAYYSALYNGLPDTDRLQWSDMMDYFVQRRLCGRLKSRFARCRASLRRRSSSLRLRIEHDVCWSDDHPIFTQFLELLFCALQRPEVRLVPDSSVMSIIKTDNGQGDGMLEFFLCDVNDST